MFRNDAEDADIRHGASRTEVTLFFEDGKSIEWWKEKGKGGCYRFEDTDYTKTGGAVPEAISEVLGIGLVEVDANTTLTPQISDQHDRPFIICETGSRRARIIGKATRLDTVVTAQMKAKSGLDQRKRDLGTEEKELAQLEEQRSALLDVGELEVQAEAARAAFTFLQESVGIFDRARALSEELREVRSRTVVDLAPVIRRLSVLHERITGAIQLNTLVAQYTNEASIIDQRTDQQQKAELTLAGLKVQYIDECRKVGVCSGCEGLLDHKECAA